jgi:hypothetical protein
MRYENLGFIVMRTDSTIYGPDATPVMVEVTARCCGSELTFDMPATRTPRIGDVVTVTVEWGEGE